MIFFEENDYSSIADILRFNFAKILLQPKFGSDHTLTENLLSGALDIDKANSVMYGSNFGALLSFSDFKSEMQSSLKQAYKFGIANIFYSPLNLVNGHKPVTPSFDDKSMFVKDTDFDNFLTDVWFNFKSLRDLSFDISKSNKNIKICTFYNIGCSFAPVSDKSGNRIKLSSCGSCLFFMLSYGSLKLGFVYSVNTNKLLYISVINTEDALFSRINDFMAFTFPISKILTSKVLCNAECMSVNAHCLSNKISSIVKQYVH